MSESSHIKLSGDTLVLPVYEDIMMRNDATVTSFTATYPEEAGIGTTLNSPLSRRRRETLFSPNGPLRPFRLLTQDLHNLKSRYKTDWFFNQLILASAVYLFFTNLLPGITFASDLYVLTHRNYGAIEVVFSTGLCGCIFAL
jgi:hypothetical protein